MVKYLLIFNCFYLNQIYKNFLFKKIYFNKNFKELKKFIKVIFKILIKCPIENRKYKATIKSIASILFKLFVNILF